MAIDRLRLSAWGTLVDPAERAAFRAAWTPGRALRPGEIAPYLEVLADATVPRLARWIAARAWVPFLSGETPALSEEIAHWAQALPAARRADVLRPLFGAALECVRAAQSPAGSASTQGPPPAPPGASADEVAMLWIDIGRRLVDDLPDADCALLALFLRNLDPWPAEARAEARALATRVIRRVPEPASDDLDPRASPATAAQEVAGTATALASVVAPWAANLAGADREEIAEFESCLREGSNDALAQVADILHRVHAAAPDCAFRLWIEIARRWAAGPPPELDRAPVAEIFTFLARHDAPYALAAVLDAYAGDAPERGWVDDPDPDELVIDFGPVEHPMGPERTFRIVDHPHFRMAWTQGSDPLAAAEGMGRVPLLLLDLAGEWSAEGRPTVLRDCLRVLLRRNVIHRFWEAALRMLTRHPESLACEGVPLLKDPGMFGALSLPTMAAIRACFPHLSDRARDAIERMALVWQSHQEAQTVRMRAWLAQAIAGAGVEGRPRTAELQALLRDPPHEPEIGTPTCLAEGEPDWAGRCDGPDFGSLSSRLGPTLEKLWRFAAEHARVPPTPEAARTAIGWFRDMVPHLRTAEEMWRGILWDGLYAALTAAPGVVTQEEAVRLILHEGPFKVPSPAFLDRRAQARLAGRGFRHAPENAAAFGTLLGGLLDDPDPPVRSEAAHALTGREIPYDDWFSDWRYALTTLVGNGTPAGIEAFFKVLIRHPEGLAGGVPRLVEIVLADASRWYRPPQETVVEVDGAEFRLGGSSDGSWEGDGAAAVVGAVMARYALYDPDDPRINLPAVLAAAEAGDRCSRWLTRGAANWLAHPGPVREGTPREPLPLRWGEDVPHGGAETRPGLTALATRLFGEAGGIPALAEKWLALARRPVATPAEDRARHDLIRAAFAVLDPLWRSGRDAAGRPWSDRLLACAAELMAWPVMAERVGRDWVGGASGPVAG